MIVGIMQPYLFPYFEYYRLIHHCDLWLAFDIAQYTRKSWMNRNRVLNREKGWVYFSVPVAHHGTPVTIQAAQIAGDQQWREKVLNKLYPYQYEAPYYGVVLDLVKTVLDRTINGLADLNLASIQSICTYLGIETPIMRVSAEVHDLPVDCAPGEWALEIAKRVGATEYRNPSGGRALFDPLKFEEKGITLSFHEHRPLTYPTGSFAPVPDLSIIDVLMWNDREIVRSWLE